MTARIQRIQVTGQIQLVFRRAGFGNTSESLGESHSGQKSLRLRTICRVQPSSSNPQIDDSNALVAKSSGHRLFFHSRASLPGFRFGLLSDEPLKHHPPRSSMYARLSVVASITSHQVQRMRPLIHGVSL